VPYDTESPFKTSGIRLGSPAMTSRGLKENDFKEIGLIITKALKNRENIEILNELKEQVLKLTSKFPIMEENDG
ncbi:MAG: serine hydroxymethyltransferase, partial [Bacilli bacterium]|nr:serine hydroxymethyltransferase [Bacilli bacterium]